MTTAHQKNGNKSDAKTYSYGYVALLVLINVGFIATTAPAFWGKVNLESLLYSGGAMEELCTPENPPVCEEQKLAISQAFTYSIASLKLSGIILGPMIDYAGPKLTALVGQFLFGTSVILLAHNWVHLGFIAMGASMNPVFNSTLSTSNLLPRQRNFVMSLLSSGGDAGYVTFWALRRIHERFGGSVKVVFFGYMTVVVFQIIMAMVFFPWKPFSVHQSPEYVDEGEPLASARHGTSSATPKKRSSDTLAWKRQALGQHPRNYHEMPLTDQLRTPHYWIFLPMFCLFFFKKAVFNDAPSEYLRQFPGTTQEQVDSMRDWFSITQALGFVWAWMFGLLADRIGVAPVLFIVNFVGILVSLLTFVPYLTVQIFTFILFAMFKSYTISSAYAFVSDAYGYAHLGTLTGIQQIVAGLCVLLNIPFRKWISHSLDNNWTIPNLILLGCNILTCLVPLYLWLRPPPVPHAPPHIRRKGTSIFSIRYKSGFRCLSAGPMFTEMDMPLCSRCQEFECCCDEDMYCLNSRRESSTVWRRSRP